MTNQIMQYFKDSYQEMKVVVWPSRRQTINHSLMVVVFSIFIAAFLGALDVLFTFGIEKLILLK